MILTCPACGTQYVVKDGAIPPAGRQVRCAACKHSWHQDPDEGAAPPEEDVAPPPMAEAPAEEPAAAYNEPLPEETVEAPAPEDRNEWSVPETESAVETDREADEEAFVTPSVPLANLEEPSQTSDYAEVEPADTVPVEVEDTVPETDGPVRAERAMAADTAYDEDFSPFASRYPDDEPRRRSRLVPLLTLVLVIALAAALFWFLAPPEWKERLGITAAGATPLQLMMTHSDRQKLASGNELLAVSGRVINPTDRRQQVPPIQASLRSSSGQLVYSWTIAPPARTLPPRASATFNSAEVNVPAGGEELTITLGEPRA